MGGIGAGGGWSVGLGSQELPRPSPLGLLCPVPASPAQGSPSCCQLWPHCRRSERAGEMLLCSNCGLLPWQEF